MRALLAFLLVTSFAALAQEQKDVTFLCNDIFVKETIPSNLNNNVRSWRALNQREKSKFLNENECLQKIKKQITTFLSSDPRVVGDQHEVTFQFPDNASFVHSRPPMQPAMHRIIDTNLRKELFDGLRVLLELKVKDGLETHKIKVDISAFMQSYDYYDYERESSKRIGPFNYSHGTFSGMVYDEDNNILGMSGGEFGDVAPRSQKSRRTSALRLCDNDFGIMLAESIQAGIMGKRAEEAGKEGREVNDDRRDSIPVIQENKNRSSGQGQNK